MEFWEINQLKEKAYTEHDGTIKDFLIHLLYKEMISNLNIQENMQTYLEIKNLFKFHWKNK